MVGAQGLRETQTKGETWGQRGDGLDAEMEIDMGIEIQMQMEM